MSPLRGFVRELVDDRGLTAPARAVSALRAYHFQLNKRHMDNFEHQRHKPPTALDVQRPLIVALPQMRSNVNAARIARAAGCCGVRRMILCGNTKLDAKVARDSLEQIELLRHRSLPPVLRSFKSEGFQIVALEQATGSISSHEIEFARKTVLVVGHERLGVGEDVLALADQVVEIPVYGRPLSYNAATATAMILYEYCRQFPKG